MGTRSVGGDGWSDRENGEGEMERDVRDFIRYSFVIALLSRLLF